MKAIGYARVSTEEQAFEGVSLAAQRESLEAYARLRQLTLTEIVVDDGVSGAKELALRPAGRRVVEAASKGKVDAVVACKLDRLFRDAADCLNTTKSWDRKNASLHLIDVGGQSIDTSSTMGRFFLTMMAGIAEMERNLIRDRTKAAMDHKRSRRERISRYAPFGFSFSEGSLVPNTSEQALLTKMIKLRENGESYTAICDYLAGQKIPTKNGASQWKPMTVKRMLDRAMKGNSCHFPAPQ